MSAAPPRVHVVCFGNRWHGDDGFGPQVYRRLHERETLPAGTEAFDAGVAGVAGLDALAHFERCHKAVIVDAVRTGGRPGTVHRLVPEDLADPGGGWSLHELGVASLLAALRAALREPPSVVVIGAEAGEVHAFSDRLSAPVRAAVPAAARLVLRECRIDETAIGSSRLE